MPIPTTKIPQVGEDTPSIGRISPAVTLNGGDSDLTLDAGAVPDASAAGPPDIPDDDGGQGGNAVEAVEELPGTGFAPGGGTTLQPPGEGSEYHDYAEDSLQIRIPTLGVQTSIVGVPMVNNFWNTDWLWDQVGYLEGTSYPTWEGNTVLTAHNYLPNGAPGPFINLAQLKWDDEIIVQMAGVDYIYAVRYTNYLAPADTSPLDHKAYNWVTLVCCYQYDEALAGYKWRVVVQAVLIDTEEVE
jgi:LPXTG-site transpeptidase (sortase) family protein